METAAIYVTEIKLRPQVPTHFICESWKQTVYFIWSKEIMDLPASIELRELNLLTMFSLAVP